MFEADTALKPLILLSLKGAMIYDLDDVPVRVKDWTELENIREYYYLFREHESDF